MPITCQVVRDIVSSFTVEEVIAGREGVTKRIEDSYRSRIESDQTLVAIKPHAVMLRGISLPKRITEAIESKIAAEYERDRILILVNATAMESIIKAKGEARAIKLRTDALKTSLCRYTM